MDVDGSYVYRKYHSQIESDNFENLPLPDVPLTGWDVIENPESAIVTQIPKVTHGMFECNISQFT